jgi:hypothetical protein
MCEKQCSVCKESKPRSEFSENKRHKDGLQYECKSCRPDLIAKQRLYQMYGLTVEQFLSMWDDCGGHCQICGVEMHSRFVDGERDDRSTRCNVDHCHESGEVRGLLCTRCNTALGKMEDDTDRLQKAIDYLQKPSTGIKNDARESDKQRQLREMDNAMRLLGFQRDSHGRYHMKQYQPRRRNRVASIRERRKQNERTNHQNT